MGEGGGGGGVRFKHTRGRGINPWKRNQTRNQVKETKQIARMQGRVAKSLTGQLCDPWWDNLGKQLITRCGDYDLPAGHGSRAEEEFFQKARVDLGQVGTAVRSGELLYASTCVKLGLVAWSERPNCHLKALSRGCTAGCRKDPEGFVPDARAVP